LQARPKPAEKQDFAPESKISFLAVTTIYKHGDPGKRQTWRPRSIARSTVTSPSIKLGKKPREFLRILQNNRIFPLACCKILRLHHAAKCRRAKGKLIDEIFSAANTAA